MYDVFIERTSQASRITSPSAAQPGLRSALLKLVKSATDVPSITLVWELQYGELAMRAFHLTSMAKLHSRPRTVAFVLQGPCERCGESVGLCQLCAQGYMQDSMRASLVQSIGSRGITAHRLEEPDELLANMTVGNPLLAAVQFHEVREVLVPWAIDEAQRLIRATPSLPLFPLLSDSYPEVY